MTLSSRFGNDDAGQVAGLQTSANDSSVRLTSIPAAGFPREVLFLPDGHTLVATRFDAKLVEFIPVPDG